MNFAKQFTVVFVSLLFKWKKVTVKYFSFPKDALRTIRDPEKPCTLEDLNVIYEDGIFIQNPTESNVYVVLN